MRSYTPAEIAKIKRKKAGLWNDRVYRKIRDKIPDEIVRDAAYRSFKGETLKALAEEYGVGYTGLCRRVARYRLARFGGKRIVGGFK